MTTIKWWEDCEPIRKSEGQNVECVYKREISASSWQYAIVTYSVDGEYLGAITFSSKVPNDSFNLDGLVSS